MTRAFAFVMAAITLFAAAGLAQAESFDSRDVMGGGPNFMAGGASPDPTDRAIAAITNTKVRVMSFLTPNLLR